MSGRVREEMIEGAERLLAEGGLEAASVPQVLKRTGAPRGSIYHHFPGGKDELIACAIDYSAQRMAALLENKKGATAVEITEYYFAIWRAALTRSDFTAGCAVLSVTVATGSPELRQHATDAFHAQHAQLAALLAHAGLDPKQAEAFATILVASAEGAVVLSRAERSTRPLDIVGENLIEQSRRMARAEGHPRRR